MRKGEERKQRLLKIAYELFVSQGYENTSVDEIIERAGIAKGTYYYHFQSKEQMLEEVIGMMIDGEVEKAEEILGSDLPIPQKIVGIIASVRPGQSEEPISEALHAPENVLMHEKVMKRLYERMVPLVAKAAEDGKRAGIFDCDDIPQRVKMVLMIGSGLFDEPGYTKKDVEVFIDVTEKIFGAKKGTMDFLKELIR